MTKYTNRASLLASGAREVTMEEMDWVSGGQPETTTGTMDPAHIDQIVVNGVPFNNFYLFSAAISSQFGNLTLTYSNVAPNFVTNGSNAAQTDPDVDGDGIPNESDPVDDTITVTAPTNSSSYSQLDYCGSGRFQGIPDFYKGIYIGLACLTHDESYGPSSLVSRFDADKQLGDDITSILIANGISPTEAGNVGQVYFLGVRTFGAIFYDGAGARDYLSDRYR